MVSRARRSSSRRPDSKVMSPGNRQNHNKTLANRSIRRLPAPALSVMLPRQTHLDSSGIVMDVAFRSAYRNRYGAAAVAPPP